MQNIFRQVGTVVLVALVVISLIGVTAGLTTQDGPVKSALTNIVQKLPNADGIDNGGSSGGGNSGGNTTINYGKPVLTGDLSAATDDNVKFTLYDSGIGIINGNGNVKDDSENGTEYDVSWDYISMYLCGYDNYDDFLDWVYSDYDEAYKDEIIQTDYKFDKLIIDEDVNFPLGLVVAHLPITDLEIKGNVTAPFLELSYLKDLKNIDISDSVNIESFAGFGDDNYAPTIDNVDFLQNDNFKKCDGVPGNFSGLFGNSGKSYLGNVVNITIPDKFDATNFNISVESAKSNTKSITFGKNFKVIMESMNSKNIETIRFTSDKINFNIGSNITLCSSTALKDIYLPEEINLYRSNPNLFKTNNSTIIHCPNKSVKDIVIANGAVNPNNVVID